MKDGGEKFGVCTAVLCHVLDTQSTDQHAEGHRLRKRDVKDKICDMRERDTRRHERRDEKLEKRQIKEEMSDGM